MRNVNSSKDCPERIQNSNQLTDKIRFRNVDVMLTTFIFVMLMMYSIGSFTGFHSDLEAARPVVVKLDVLLWLSESNTSIEFNFRVLFLFKKDF